VRQRVVHERAGEELAGLVVAHILHEALAQALEPERRPARAGAFDAVTAAAAALTVKTMLRLPPLEGTPPQPPIPVASTEVLAAAPGGPELRIQAGIAGRLARGSQTDFGARASLGAMVRPWSDHGWRIGLAGDLDTATTISGSGFKGTWRAWALLGMASWTWSTARLEVEPMLGGGVSRSWLDGEIGQEIRTEAATLPVIRGGVTVRWPAGMWSVGASVGADVLIGTPTYTRINGRGNPTTLFEVPAFAAVVGVFAAADLGR
jgi:hypothetical protein